MKNTIFKLFFLFALYTTVVGYSQQPGTFNTTYGNSGVSSRPIRFSNFVTESASLQNSKLLISGRLANENQQNILLRINEGGAIDRNFGDNGVIYSPFSTAFGESHIAMFENGDFYWTLNDNFTPSIFKYSNNGVLNQTFGNTGEVKLDFLNGNFRFYTAPVIDPVNGEIEIPVSSEITNTNSDYSFILKLEGTGSIDMGYGNNGYSQNFPGSIMTMDRNPFTNSFFEDIFGGAKGDLNLGIRGNSSLNFEGYSQYVEDSGAFIDNSSNSISASSIVGRFYERQFPQLVTNLVFFDGSNLFYLVHPNSPPTLNFQQTYLLAESGKPGFKIVNDEEFILYGSSFGSDFLVSKVGGGANNLDPTFGDNGSTLVDISAEDNLDDFMIDLFEKPNSKLLGVGHSLIDNLVNSQPNNTLSMLQLEDDGDLDASFGNNGIILFDNSFITNNGQIINTPISNNPSINYKPWVGVITEPYTGRKYVEIINPLFNHPNDISLGEVPTYYTDLTLNDVDKYIDNTVTDLSRDEIVLGVGKVNNGTDNNFSIVRFKETSAGFQNNFFGSPAADVLQTDINNGSDDEASSFIIQNDNGTQKILVVGQSDGNLAMARYFADGNDAGLLDPSFGNGGIIRNQLVSNFIPEKSVLSQDNTFFVGGEEIEGAIHRYILKKYNEDGSLDNSFSAFDEIENAGENVVSNFIETSNNNLITIGRSFVDGEYELKIRKYDSSGKPISDFGDNSYVTLNTSDQISAITDIVELSNGGIAVVGHIEDSLLVMVINKNTGAFDQEFANDGILSGNFDFDSIKLSSVTQEDPNNILISGVSVENGISQVYNAKVYISEVLDVDDFILEEKIIVYPNPVNEILNVKYPKNLNIKDLSINDQLGRELIYKDSSFEKIDISKLTTGTYFLKIRTNQKSIAKKLIIR